LIFQGFPDLFQAFISARVYARFLDPDFLSGFPYRVSDACFPTGLPAGFPRPMSPRLDFRRVPSPPPFRRP
jgi:hypothetical protein